MAEMGHSRPMGSGPVPINVRCYFDSGIIVLRSEVTRRADAVEKGLRTLANNVSRDSMI